MTTTRIFMLAGGVLLAALSVGVYQRKRPLRLFAMLAFVVGLVLAAMALWPDLLAAAIPSRLRISTSFVSLLILFITLETVRRTSLKERYALLWVGTSCVLFVFAVYPDTVAWLVAMTGMYYTSAIMVIVFTFLILVSFHFSLALSRYEDERREIVQAVGMLEARLREVEEKLQALQRSGHEPPGRADGREPVEQA
jgi:hypothetical protein